MPDIDVTNLVEFENSDDEVLPITRCVCGQRFPAWRFIISIYSDDPYHCDACNRGLYFSNTIRIFQKVDGV